MTYELGMKINFKTLMHFALPSVIMMLVMSMYTVIDGIFVARLVNTDAFSAVNIAYPLVGICVAVGTMFGTGIAAVASHKLGEGKGHEACENISFTLLFSFILCAVLGGVSLLLVNQITTMLGADAATFEYCRAYLIPVITFSPIFLLQMQFQSLFVVNGKPNVGLITTALGGVINIVLDYIFIKFFGWGIAGAAIATSIGASIPAIYGVISFAVGKNDALHFVRPKADWKMLLIAVGNGSSEMVSNLSGSVTTYLFNIAMMHHLGSDGVAAISILLYIDYVLIAISLGYSIGVAPLFSYNYGNQNEDKLRKLYRLSIGFCGVTGVAMAAITVIFAPQLSGAFIPVDSPVYELAVHGLRICAISYLFKGFNIFSSAVFTAFSNGRVSAILSFLRTLLFLAGAIIGLSVLFGVNGIWYAQPLAELLALGVCIAYTIRYRKQYHFV